MAVNSSDVTVPLPSRSNSLNASRSSLSIAAGDLGSDIVGLVSATAQREQDCACQKRARRGNITRIDLGLALWVWLRSVST